MTDSLRLNAWTQPSSLTLRELARAIRSGKIAASREDVDVYTASQVFPETAENSKASRLNPVASLAWFAMSKLHLSFAETMDGVPVAVIFQMIAAFNEENGVDFRFGQNGATEKERRMNEALEILKKSQTTSQPS